MKQKVLPVASLSNVVSAAKIMISGSRNVRWSFILCICGLMSSCTITPNLEDTGKPAGALPETNNNARLATTALPATVTISKVDLYLSKGSAATGAFTVQLRDSSGIQVLDSARVTVDSIRTGSGWNTFRLTSTLTLVRGAKYRLYVRRSVQHNSSTNNAIYWMTSSGGTDTYPKGVNDVYPSWTLDYGFRTYTNGGIDQQQTQIGYGFFTSNNFYRWQEFRADYPKVNLTSIALNLQVGSGVTGKLYLAIQSENGIDTLAKSTVLVSTLPVGSNWVTFNMPATLYRDQKYHIFVHRSDSHNYPTGNYIFWSTSSGGVNAYPDGINDVYPSWTLDYAFKTYSSLSGLDQQQTLATYGFAVHSNGYRWQEFIPRHQ